MDEITAYCKDNRVMKVFLGKKDIFLENEEKMNKEGLIRCENLEKLLKDSLKGENIDFSKYLDLDLLGVTDFEKQVYIETMKIPKGQVKSYKEIAESIIV